MIMSLDKGNILGAAYKLTKFQYKYPKAKWMLLAVINLESQSPHHVYHIFRLLLFVNNESVSEFDPTEA